MNMFYLEINNLFYFQIGAIRCTPLWIIIALIGTVIAAGFAVILIGLDAKAARDANNRSITSTNKAKILAAQLAFACFEFILCAAFIGASIIALLLIRRPSHPPRFARY